MFFRCVVESIVSLIYDDFYRQMTGQTQKYVILKVMELATWVLL